MSNNAAHQKRRVRLSEAVAIIAEQADCTLEAAETKLRVRAVADGRFVDDMARAVVARVIRFGP